MNWRKRYARRKAEKITDIKKGDLISYTRSGENRKRYAIVESIKEGESIWGHFNYDKELALKRRGDGILGYSYTTRITFNETGIYIEGK